MSLSLLQAALEAPEQTAVICAGKEYSYGELAGRVAALRDRLLVQGADSPSHDRGSRPRLAYRAPLSLESLLLFYALLELDIEVAFLHPRWTPEEVDRALAALAPCRLVVPEHLLEGLVSSSPERGGARGSAGEESARAVRDAFVARWILHTSGSSGRPKAAMASDASFLAAAASAANLGWRAGDRWLLSLPLAHVGGLSVLTRCLLARSCAVMEPASRFDAARLTRWIERRQITLLSLVPTMLRRLLELRPIWHPPAHLRAILVGGAAASADLLAAAAERGLPVLTTYGLTETCSQVATQPLGTRQRGELGCGSPLPGVEVRIREEQIEVRGPTVFAGYLVEGALERPFQAGGWFRTGDRGHLDEAGYLHVSGRADEVLISGGENIHPEEVEEVLESHPAIAGACVVGVPDPRWGQEVVAILEATSEPVEEEALRVYCRQRLATFKCPKRWLWVGELPRTAAGKKRRRRTAELVRPSSDRNPLRSGRELQQRGEKNRP